MTSSKRIKEIWNYTSKEGKYVLNKVTKIMIQNEAIWNKKNQGCFNLLRQTIWECAWFYKFPPTQDIASFEIPLCWAKQILNRKLECILKCTVFKVVKRLWKNTHSCMALTNLWFEIESAINVHCIQDEYRLKNPAKTTQGLRINL